MAKKGFGQTIMWRLEAFAYDVVCLLLKPFSFDQISGFGGWLLQKIGPKTSKHHIARTGLQTAFPDASEAHINTWLDAQWNNTGRTFAEFPILHRIKVFGENSRVTVNGLRHLEALRDGGTPAVIVTGHFANWEVMAAALTQSGLPVQITYRKINNPYIDKRIREQREAYGTKLLVAKSGAKGAKQLLKSLSSGESVALLNDQKFNEGLSVPFFGTPAMTAPGPTRLALKSGAPILPLSITRDKARFVMTVHAPIHLENTGNRIADIERGVALITRFTEDRIKEAPAQWFWVHRRWPKPHYRAEEKKPLKG